MDRDRFLSLRFKPYMELEYIIKRFSQGYEYTPVMFIAIDYDNDVFKVVKFSDLEELKNDTEFWTSRDHIELPKHKLKISK